ncbi:hypothetical protein [Sphingobium chungbukense]|uniref:Uncharacterized protein n=1 Tax=Sphingobium chungbukense TaxID=56193 RepID=A0A0M3ARM6_9SPHN|nr:hypothetical protein [Sphingobium chungbukense]KKW92500.1 hypothetical protein YP76_05950 [Sphingobium chungbukense]
MQTMTARDTDAYLDALLTAKRRAASSYFDQHILRDTERGYIAIDEGDYAWLTEEMIESIVLTIPGEVIDEY